MGKKKIYHVKPLTERKKNINYHKFISPKYLNLQSNVIKS